MDLHVLLVEDDPDDCELVLHRLRSAGWDPVWSRVASLGELTDALERARWDLALVDYNLPGFSGLEALHVLSTLAPDLPSITVSGTITEETAVQTLTAGALDYVLKDNLTRLAPAVQKALERAELHRRQRLADADQRFPRFVVERAGDLIFWMRADGRLKYANPAACRALGYTLEEFERMTVHDFDQKFPDELWPEHIRELRAAGSLTFESILRRKDGTETPTEITAQYLEYDGNAYTVGFGRDITERKLAEEALRESEELYRAMFEENRAIKLLIDSETAAIVDANQAALDFYGYTSAEMCSLKVDDLNTLPPEQIRAAIDGLVRDNVSTFFFKHRLKDGEVRDVEVHSGPMEVRGRKLLLSIVQDATERVRAQETLRTSEELLRQSQSAARVGHYVIDVAARTWTSSAVLDEVFGIGEDYERSAEGWLRIVHPEDRAATLAHLEGDVLGEGRDFNREYRIVRISDGATRWVHGTGSLDLDADGSPVRMFGVVQDVTERHQAEDDLRHHADRLRRTLEGSVNAMSQIVESRDPYTAGHERRVTELAVAIGEELGIGDGELDGLRLASLIHDVGKIAVPAEILSKPGRLSDAELNLIRRHAQAGHDILTTIEFDQPIAQITLQHHERIDGSGYPQGLRGDGILPQARILAVADVVEAMSSHRPYRPSLGREPALAEIRENAGVTYDAEVAAACLRVVTQQGFTFSD